MFTCLLLNVSLTLGQSPPDRPEDHWQPIKVEPASAAAAPVAPAPVHAPVQLAPALSVPTPAARANSSMMPDLPFLQTSAALQSGAENTPKAEKKEGENGKDKEKDKKDEDKPKKFEYLHNFKPDPATADSDFFHRLYSAYWKQFFPEPKKEGEPEPEEPPRRAMPSPFASPPFPGSEYQGYPLLGVPASDTVYPLMEAIYGSPGGDWFKDNRIKIEGWMTTYGDISSAKNSNSPTSYWFQPNDVGLDQFVMRVQREADTVQTENIDWGFRAVGLWGQDYRYMQAGGWGSDVEYQKHNLKDGWDPTEVYGNVYIPGFLGGTDIRVGRWIACPDIETQYSVDNYLGSHSILFTYDTYTDTGIMVSQKIDDQWMVQLAVDAGTDMAPWFKGAQLTGSMGVRYVTKDNNDAFYVWENAWNTANFRHFVEFGEDLGRDNFNYVVGTWEHRFNEGFITKTEAYYMWQWNAEVGGTPSIGPVQSFGGGGGNGELLPGLSKAGGVLNYTVWGLSDRDYLTLRNEWYDDCRGMRTGYAGNYTSHTIGISHQFNDVTMLRPEVGYYRNWDNPAFDLGTKKGIWIYGADFTIRF